MTISEKIKMIDNKIEQNRAQKHLEKRNAKTLALLLGNFGKHKFLTDEDILPGK